MNKPKNMVSKKCISVEYKFIEGRSKDNVRYRMKRWIFHKYNLSFKTLKIYTMTFIFDFLINVIWDTNYGRFDETSTTFDWIHLEPQIFYKKNHIYFKNKKIKISKSFWKNYRMDTLKKLCEMCTNLTNYQNLKNQPKRFFI